MIRDEPLAHAFRGLFRGRTDAIGLNKGGVQRRPVTLMDYGDHLEGRDAIGIFPMLDSNECYFGAIDLDEPNFELAQAMQLLVPGASWIERSRTGNAHVWVFFDTPCPAWAIRTILRGATEAVGRKDVEIFPKQDRLREGMVGNYINLPYFGSGRPVLRYSDTDEAWHEYDLAGFVELATQRRHDPNAWVRRAAALGGVPPEDREVESEWGEAPILHECATYIIQGADSGERPLRAGHRHQVLFHLSKQLLNYRDLTADEAWHEVEKVNQHSDKPLYVGEVRRLFDNAIAGRYTSTGCDDPVMAPYVRPDCPIANG